MNDQQKREAIRSSLKITETGIGILAKDDILIIEHRLSGAAEGKEWRVPAARIWEFRDDKVINFSGSRSSIRFL
jgi:hypothetical protein